MKKVILLFTALSACDPQTPLLQSTPPGTENVKHIKIVPIENRDQPVVGTTFPLQVLGVNADGSEIDITKYTIFESRDRKKATVETDGLVIGKSSGNYTIKGTFAGHTTSYVGAFFDSPIIDLAIQRAGVSIDDGGCFLNKTDDSCGLAVGQSTTPRFIATFENGDRSNLRRSENLTITKSSAAVNVERDGILTRTIKALTTGTYKITATYTNAFDETDTETVESPIYKVVVDDPATLAVDGPEVVLENSSTPFIPNVFRVSGRMFVPRAQANVDEGICLSDKHGHMRRR